MTKITTPQQSIITSHVYPPIPDRSHDWCAYYDGREEDGNYGWGETEQEAIEDLQNRDEEDDTDRTDELNEQEEQRHENWMHLQEFIHKDPNA